MHIDFQCVGKLIFATPCHRPVHVGKEVDEHLREWAASRTFLDHTGRNARLETVGAPPRGDKIRRLYA
jgi:hypothetical protein